MSDIRDEFRAYGYLVIPGVLGREGSRRSTRKLPRLRPASGLVGVPIENVLAIHFPHKLSP